MSVSKPAWYLEKETCDSFIKTHTINPSLVANQPYMPIIPEVLSATNYLCQLVSNFLKLENHIIDFDTYLRLKQSTFFVIYNRVAPIWYPQSPLRGQAKRLISRDVFCIDPDLFEIAKLTKISSKFLLDHLPQSFYIWINPWTVSVKLGGEWSPVSDIYPANFEDFRIPWKSSEEQHVQQKRVVVRETLV